MMGSVADRYQRFARVEAKGRSPVYEAFAMQVAQSPDIIRFLERLPLDRQQPNLLFAAIRLVAGIPPSTQDLNAALREHADAIAEVMLTRTTQTNEPSRCATLLPALVQIEGPLALIEVGASAGLCLLPDAYGYDWGRQRLIPPDWARATAPTFSCDASEDTPLPSRHPQIVWRAGVDLNPLDVSNDEDVAWLEHLVWPEHEGRLARLRAAISVAQQIPPRIEAGDLNHDLPELIAQAPSDAKLVIFHTAVLSYVSNQKDRDDFARMLVDAGVIWLSNEAAHVFPQFAKKAGTPNDDMFLLTANGQPIAWSGPHGQSLRWISQSSPSALRRLCG